MKTLHPGVHGGILAIRDNPAHMIALSQHGIATIDVVRGATPCELQHHMALLLHWLLGRAR